MVYTKYPKNWHQNGYGWHNPASLTYGGQKAPPSETSSGVSSLYPDASSQCGDGPNIGFQLAYGFAPGVLPCQVPNARKESSGSPTGGRKPNLGWVALTADTHSIDEVDDVTAVSQEEIPCQSIFVPLEDQPIYGHHLGEQGSGSRFSGAAVQDFNAIRQQCLANGELFEDPDFPAVDSSLQFSRRPDRPIKWLRPMEIAEDPQFFVEGYSRFDVQQGELGDCWLLAATATLTQDPKLFFRVVPDDQNFEEGYAGCFHFRFWQYGRWIDVVIDDRLPTYRGELLYMHSTEKNEFWSALLEKAYAKLHGSYEALKGGTTCEAMEDFTGGVTEMYELKEAPPNLFSILMKAYERNSMLACSIEPDPNVTEAETESGLIRGHAYSITKVTLMDIVTPNAKGAIPMVRMRNPWGNEAEWNGPWSDQSSEWRFIPEHVKMDIGLTFDNDGEFWMSFKDWMHHFDRVEMCNLSPDSLSEEQISGGKKKWEMSVFEGEWTAGATAGGCRNYLNTFWHNPQYVVTLVDPDDDDDEGKCTVIIGLMQKNRRSQRNIGIDCLTIGFAVYSVTERDLANKPLKMNFFKYNQSVARSPAFINLREVSCRFKLPPGHYIIVPSTFEPNEEAEFLIRVFSENKNHMEENDEEVGVGEVDDRVLPSLPEPSRPDPRVSALEKLFIDIAGEDGEVDWMELKRILDHSMRDDLIGSVITNDNQAAPVAQRAHTVDAAGNGDDGGGGGADTGLCGSILSIFCAAFCKDNPLGEAFGMNEQNNDGRGGAGGGGGGAGGGGGYHSNGGGGGGGGGHGFASYGGGGFAPPDGVHQPADPITSQIMQPDQTQHGFSKDVCRSMVAMMDKDGTGKLGFEEFQELLTDIAKWKAVFKLYDHDHSGSIQSYDLREALQAAGYKLNNRALNALAHRYSGTDGTITFDDFIGCTVKVKTMMNMFKEHDADGTNRATFSLDDWMERTMH